MRQKLLLLTLIQLLMAGALAAQQPANPKPTTPPAVTHSPGPSTTPAGELEADSVTITIILKHQQDKNLPEIRRILEAQGFWDVFPPSDVRVVSWTLAMGLGHIIVVKLPAGAIRRLNLALENGAWGAFDTEIFISYDYMKIWQDYLEQREEAKDDRN